LGEGGKGATGEGVGAREGRGFCGVPNHPPIALQGERRGFCRVPNHPPIALQGRQKLFEFAGRRRSLGASRPPQADPFPSDPCWGSQWISHFPLSASALLREASKRLNICSRPCRPSPAWPLSSSPISPPSGKACCRKFWRVTRACRC